MNVYKYLPFLDNEDLEELVEKIKSKEVTNVPLYKLFPFVSTESLDQLVDYMIEEQDNANLTKSLPFISEDALSKIKEAIKNNTLTDFSDWKLLPFMDSKSVKDLFYSSLKNHQEQPDDENEDQDEE